MAGLAPSQRQHLVLEPERVRRLRDPFGFVARLGAQSMIDGRDQELHVRSVALRPARDEVQHRHAVGAAGDGEDDFGKASERSEQRCEFAVADAAPAASGSRLPAADG